MKKAFFYTLGIMAVTMMSCQNGKQPPSSPTLEIDPIQEETSPPDSTIYGRCGENFGMSTLELITDNGDTLLFILEDDSIPTIKGGKHVGDRMAIVASKNDVGENVVRTGVNLTTLLGKWTALDKTFEIHEGGVVTSQFQEPKPYTEWKISNGALVLSADTFSVYDLGADSLLLENDKGIYSYKRQK